jgi:hypothetical protein
MNQAQTISSRSFPFNMCHNSQSQTILCNHQPTKLHNLSTFLPVSRHYMVVVNLQMLSPTVGKSQCLYALWDMTYVTTLKNTVYLASLILFFGTRTQVYKTCIFPTNLGRIVSLGSEQFSCTYSRIRTFRICNTYCFSSPTVVAWSILDVNIVFTLPGLFDCMLFFFISSPTIKFCLVLWILILVHSMNESFHFH